VRLELAEIKELMQALSTSDLAELNLESEDFKLHLKKAAPSAVASGQAFFAPAAQQVAPPRVETPIQPEAAAELVILSPMVGTFYRASGPDVAPFVELGDRVTPGQPVCLIEAMKLMNEIESELSGRVTRFLVENGEGVEFGQPLLALSPV
jgi:acetyl-CoA carboxylase biotin carboxyl carrier protein